MNPIQSMNLGHLTRINKVLVNFKKRRRIRDFTKVENIAFNGLIYRVSVDGRRMFDVRIKFAKTFSPKDGAEVAEIHGWEVTLLVSQSVTINRITHLLNDEILRRQSGIILEKRFHEHLERIIEKYPDFGDVVGGVTHATEDEDVTLKIDRFILLKSGVKVPIQIKGSISGRVAHKMSGSEIPSLIYSKKMSDELLLEKVLQICSSYQNGYIEHI